jgi:glycine dehydrogenase subunit 2
LYSKQCQRDIAEPLIFELLSSDRAYDEEEENTLQRMIDAYVPSALQRKRLPELPELAEPEVIRHYIRLSQMNYAVDIGMYPLGSCTMKYTPKLCEELAMISEVTDIHPDQDPRTVQGALKLMYELQRALAEIGGMDAVTLQPAAGAHGEFLGLLIVKAYHQKRGEATTRTEVILPDTAHGTNPASAAMAGYDVIELPSKFGYMDIESLQAAVSERTAALMLTNPNTLGIFEPHILDMAKIVHDAGALLYYDGANLNAILGWVRPGDMGFDIVHFNLHKTFGTPHGGGGPGAGPIGVKRKLARFLPVPQIAYDDAKDYYYLDYNIPDTIGKIKSYYGNFAILVRAYAYIKLMGADGLKSIADYAVLNANYMKSKLQKYYELPFEPMRKHEFVLSCKQQKQKGVTAMQIAKRLIDYGFHAPTVYFPLLVDEALMIEPTETEPKETLDAYIQALIDIAAEVDKEPSTVKTAPHSTPIGKIDEVGAAKSLVLSWKDYNRK